MKNSRGFTLVEMLLATVLTTILMVGVLAVITTLGTRGAVADGARPLEGLSDAQAAEACARLVREDLDVATHIDATKTGELRLSGYGALDARSRERTGRPVNIRYAVEEIDGRPWLVRRQESLDAVGRDDILQDLVCAGVRRMELVKTPPDLKDGPPVEGPRAWRLRLWTSDAAEPTFDFFMGLAPEGGA
jgi:hypothetical protein